MVEPARCRAGSGRPASAPWVWQPVQSMIATRYAPRRCTASWAYAAPAAATRQKVTTAGSDTSNFFFTRYPRDFGACRLLRLIGAGARRRDTRHASGDQRRGPQESFVQSRPRSPDRLRVGLDHAELG